MRRLLIVAAIAAVAIGLSAQPEDGYVRVSVFGLLQPTEVRVQPIAGRPLAVEAGKARIILEGAQFARLVRTGDSLQVHYQGDAIVTDYVRVSRRDGGAADFLLQFAQGYERRYRGTLLVRPDGHHLEVVVTMDRETAVASTVAAESPPGAPLEALKAQAVVARSFYAAATNRHDDFAFCDTTHCQYLREPPQADSLAWQATQETRGLVLQYRGKTIEALQSASCGGRSKTLAEVGMAIDEYPYFSVECPYCRRYAASWDRRLDARQVARLLEGEGKESERVALGRRLGWDLVPSNNYQVAREGNFLVVEGRGRGHGVGLCQEGAAAMAAAGADFKTILRHFFPNTELSTSGVSK